MQLSGIQEKEDHAKKFLTFTMTIELRTSIYDKLPGYSHSMNLLYINSSTWQSFLDKLSDRAPSFSSMQLFFIVVLFVHELLLPF